MGKGKGYKMDETRERRTRVVSARMDDRTLAVLSEAFDSQGIKVRSLSELVYLSCRSLVGMIRNDVMKIDLMEARQYLSSKFNIPLDPPGQRVNAYAKQLQVDQAFTRRSKGDFGGTEGLPLLDGPTPEDYSSAPTLKTSSINRPGDEITDELVNEALKIAQDKMKQVSDGKEQARESIAKGFMQPKDDTSGFVRNKSPLEMQWYKDAAIKTLNNWKKNYPDATNHIYDMERIISFIEKTRAKKYNPGDLDDLDDNNGDAERVEEDL